MFKDVNDNIIEKGDYVKFLHCDMIDNVDNIHDSNNYKVINVEKEKIVLRIVGEDIEYTTHEDVERLGMYVYMPRDFNGHKIKVGTKLISNRSGVYIECIKLIICSYGKELITDMPKMMEIFKYMNNDNDNLQMFQDEMLKSEWRVVSK